MPTITIKQFDNTSAGVLRQPKNVFLMGPSGTSSDDALTADSNGVYYFTSKTDFQKTIGKCEPAEYKYNKDGTDYACKSYGNQMAAELLTLGYNVYYYSIGSASTEPAALAEESVEPATPTDLTSIVTAASE